jgi:site-specific DNA-methyltransferase (adenine-specific)
MTWLKDNYGHALLAKKAPLNYTEDVCVFFKRHRKHDFEGFHPLRSYARKVLDYIGGTIKSINKDLGHRRAEHFFYVETTQFNLCTERTYNDLIRLYHIDKMPWFREYGDLKAVDREYREALIERMNNATPRRFNLPPGAKYKSNVLQYKKDYSGHHPTQKPVALMEDLIQTYTIEGETVLDFTMGSGTTGVAAANLNRQFIGIELDPEYYRIAMDRIEKEAQ